VSVTPHETAIQALLTRDPLFGNCLNVAGALPEPVLRVPAGFPGLLRIILEQQVSTKAAEAMWRKLSAMADPVSPEAVLALDDDALRQCGFSRQKMAYARGLAEDVASGRLDIEAVHRMPDDEALESLVRIKGIGRWSAEIYLLLVLGRPDVWPVTRGARTGARRPGWSGIITFRWRRRAGGRKHCHSSGSLTARP
jgi:DNA-3-methyladenine glycosylase II